MEKTGDPLDMSAVGAAQRPAKLEEIWKRGLELCRQLYPPDQEPRVKTQGELQAGRSVRKDGKLRALKGSVRIRREKGWSFLVAFESNPDYSKAAWSVKECHDAENLPITIFFVLGVFGALAQMAYCAHYVMSGRYHPYLGAYTVKVDLGFYFFAVPLVIVCGVTLVGGLFAVALRGFLHKRRDGSVNALEAARIHELLMRLKGI